LAGLGEKKGRVLIARLNARLQPIDRGYFEDPLDDALRAAALGEVTGGGTQLADEPAGIAFCDIEIAAKRDDDEVVAFVIARLEDLGAPKGSRLLLGDQREKAFGRNEGLALFVNGVDLPTEVYERCDINHVISECERLMAGRGAFRSYWRGRRETGLYFYGPSFAEMKAAIEPFAATYALCRQSRIEQIA
jgi:hypothetical protein